MTEVDPQTGYTVGEEVTERLMRRAVETLLTAREGIVEAMALTGAIFVGTPDESAAARPFGELVAATRAIDALIVQVNGTSP